MTKKTLAFVGAALMAVSLSLGACSKKQAAPTTPTPAEEAKPAEGGEGTTPENPCGGANPCGGNPCGGANPCGGGQ